MQNPGKRKLPGFCLYISQSVRRLAVFPGGLPELVTLTALRRLSAYSAFLVRAIDPLLASSR